MSSHLTATNLEPLTTPASVPPASGAHSFRPETYRLPRPGERDPYFGLGRAWYYSAEQRGDLKLIRLRKRGNLRGVTLVPYDEVAKLIRRLS